MPLRPIEPRTVKRDLGIIRVWREDLAKIVSVMRQTHPDLTLQIDGYTLDDISELEGVENPTTRSFTAVSADSRVRLELSAHTASVSADNPDLQTRGMLEEVHRIATRRDREKRRDNTLIAARTGTVAATLALSFPATKYPESGWWTGAATLAFVGVMAVFFISPLPPRRQAIVNLRTRSEAPPWLERNKDALVTNAIVSFVFLVIGILIGLAINPPE